MIPPTFQIGDEVLITGPSGVGCKLRICNRFTIEQIDRDKYSGYGLPYYPASSLRLVNEKPLSPMHITYNYKPDDVEHGTIQVSCPCGRKAEIDPKLDEELKIGDFVEVIGPCAPIYGTRSDDPKIFEIKSIFENGLCNGDMCRPSYPATSLRKLTPEEIAKHLAPPTNTPQNQFNEKTDARLSATEKQLKEFDGEISHLLASIQECLMESGDVEARTRCREMAIEKRLDFVEKFQRDQTKDALYKGWRAGP